MVLALLVKQPFRNVLRGYAMLEVSITALFQRFQKEFVRVTIKAVRIWFIWVPVGIRNVVFLLCSTDVKVDRTGVYVIQRVVESYKINVVLLIGQMNDLTCLRHLTP